MTETNKIIIAVVAVIFTGFLLVWGSKQDTPQQLEAASMVRTNAAMREMANQKCPNAIKQETGEQVYFPVDTQSDKDTYITLNYAGETGKFKKAKCTLHMSVGGISELIIDDKVIIQKKVK